MLIIDNLYAHFDQSGFVIRGISLQIDEGDTVALIGESGSGKSMTALSILRLMPQYPQVTLTGEILFHNQNLLSLSQEKLQRIRGKHIAMISQDPMKSLNPILSIGTQITESIRYHDKTDAIMAYARAIELLKDVHMDDPVRIFHSYPHQLSGGMRQRAMIAIAISCNPSILIADEPTTALDVTTQSSILSLLKKLQVKYRTAILFISHDLPLVENFANHVYIMYAGKIVESGPIKQVFQLPKHPYTKSLLASLPRDNQREYYLHTIPGSIPNIAQYRSIGCDFSDRCYFSKSQCNVHTPQYHKIQDGQSVACLMYEEENNNNSRTIVQPPLEARPNKILQMDYYLTIEDLDVRYPKKNYIFRKKSEYVHAVRNVSFKIKKESTFAIVGESGSGKTTLARSILNLNHQTTGGIYFHGMNPTEYKLPLFRQQNQIIFQDPYSSLNPRRTIYSMLSEILLVHFKSQEKKERDQTIQKTLEAVGLNSFMQNRYPHEFSGGQQQRIAIARALILKPKFIICDEITSSLDVSIQSQILNLLDKLQRQFCLTYLMITHDLHIVKYMADEVAFMRKGQIIEQGEVEQVFNEPQEEYTKSLLMATNLLKK